MTWCLCIPALRPAFCFSFSFFWHARLHHYWWFHLLATPETENILSINYQWFLVKLLLLLLDSKEDIQISGFGWYSMSCCPAFIEMVIVSEIFSKDWNYKLQPLSIFQTGYNCFFILLHFSYCHHLLFRYTFPCDWKSSCELPTKQTSLLTSPVMWYISCYSVQCSCCSQPILVGFVEMHFSKAMYHAGAILIHGSVLKQSLMNR